MTWKLARDLRDRPQIQDKIVDAAAAVLGPGAIIDLVATPKYLYPPRVKALDGDLVLFLAGKVVAITKGKAFGGAKMGWQASVTDFRGSSEIAPYANDWAFTCALNSGTVKFVFSTYEAAENVQADLRAAKEWS